jgi:putative flippase GtrA
MRISYSAGTRPLFVAAFQRVAYATKIAGVHAFGSSIGELVRFAMVGGAAMLTYLLISVTLIWSGTAILWASAVAYLVGCALSFLGHRFFTFASRGGFVGELFRFCFVNAGGFAAALIGPAVIIRRLAFSPLLALVFTCVLVPILNYFALKALVFCQRPSSASG